MNKIYDTQIPQKDLLHTTRLLSNNGISYFGNNDNCFVDKSMIDAIDAPIRILSDFLMKKECKISSFFCGIDDNKEKLKEIWNYIKREEKIIRTTGLDIKKLNGESFVFKDPEYRVYWPSFESFLHEYPLSSKQGWLCFCMPIIMEQQISIIKNRPDIFNAKIESETKEDYEKICLIIDNGDIESSNYIWRRITGDIVSILEMSGEIVT